MAKARFGQQADNPSPTTEEVVRLILAQEVEGLVKYSPRARDGHDPEAVHQLRVRARRLRSELEIVAPAIRTKPMKQMSSDLKWAGGVLGRERDLDVLHELLSSLSDGPSHVLDATVLESVDAQRAEKTERVQAMINSKRYRHMVRDLRSAVDNPPLRASASKPASEVLHPVLIDTLSSIFKTVELYGGSPTSLELHEIRKMAKRGRYGAEVASTYLGERATILATTLAEAQGVLGNIHDQIEAIVYLSAQRLLLDRDFAFSASSEAPSAAIDWLTHSVTGLMSKWRAPLERARCLSENLDVEPVKVRSFFESHAMMSETH
jgi:CHAD domain-containing protein